MIQFHHTILNLTNSKPLTNWQVITLMKLKFEHACDPDLQLCDSVLIFKSILTPVSLPNLDHILGLTLIPIPINLEHEPSILESHNPLMRNEYEPLLFDLHPTLEPNMTLESLLDLNQLPESVLVPVPLTLEPKSTISPIHIQLLDQGVRQYNSEMIYQDWSFNPDNFHDGIFMILFNLGVIRLNRLEVKGEFL